MSAINNGFAMDSPGEMDVSEFARRILSAMEIIDTSMPLLVDITPRRIMLSLLVADHDGGRVVTVETATPEGETIDVTTRWIRYLVKEGLVKRDEERLELTSLGRELVVRTLQKVYSAQRHFD
jgi:predicted transcriptional regulator